MRTRAAPWRPANGSRARGEIVRGKAGDRRDGRAAGEQALPERAHADTERRNRSVAGDHRRATEHGPGGLFHARRARVNAAQVPPSGCSSTERVSAVVLLPDGVPVKAIGSWPWSMDGVMT